MLSPKIIDLSAEDYLQYDSPSGSFFLYDIATKDRLTTTIECREEIEADWTEDYPEHRTIGFSTGRAIDVKQVAALWAAMEKRLSPQIKHQSTVYAATVSGPKPSAFLINLSTFWIKSPVRRSVATLMIRLIAIHCAEKGLTFAQGLKVYDLTAQCSRALKHFFSGHTKMTAGWNSMWIEWDEEHGEEQAYSEGNWGDDDDEAAIPAEPYDTGADADSIEHCGFADEMTNDRPFADIKRLLIKP